MTNFELELVNLSGLDTDTVEIAAKGTPVLPSGRRLGRAWSRDWRVTVARDDPRLRAIVDQARAEVLAVESDEWAELGTVAGIEIADMDYVRYGSKGWGVFVNYHRLDTAGRRIEGWDGRLLYQMREGDEFWRGTEGKAGATFTGTMRELATLARQLMGAQRGGA